MKITRANGLWILALACAATSARAGDEPDPEAREPPPKLTQGAAAPRFDLRVEGADADPDKLDTCREEFTAWGAIVDDKAAVHVQLLLDSEGNRLVIRGRAPGARPLYDAARPGWRMSTLCKDALAVALEVAGGSARSVGANPAPVPGPSPASGGRAATPAPAPPSARRLALDWSGANVRPVKIQHCHRTFQANGVVVDPEAPVRVQLVLDPTGNRMTVRTPEGVAVERVLHHALMGPICQEALTAGLQQLLGVGAHPEGRVVPEATDPDETPPPEVKPAPSKGPAADPVAEAKAHHERATRQFNAGHFAEAAAEWTAAYDLDPRPQFLYNAGSAWRRKGEIDNSASSLKRARHFFMRYQDLAHTPEGEQQLRAVDAALVGAK